MLSLILTILCSASINLGFALAKEKGQRNLAVTWFNYFMASAVSAGMLLRSLPLEGKLSFSALAGNLRGGLTPDGSLTLAILFGAAVGGVYIAALLSVQYSILRCGPSPATMFNRLGTCGSVLLSMVIFGERPSVLCWCGIALAMTALVIYNSGTGSFRPQGILALTFVLGAVSEFSNKLFSAWCLPRYKPLYLLCVFGTAWALCTLVLWSRRKGEMRGRFTLGEAALGCAVGCVNLGSAFFLIRALDTLPATVVFPAMCGGVVALIALLGRVFFREQLGKRGWTAIALTVVSLVLINLYP